MVTLTSSPAVADVEVRFGRVFRWAHFALVALFVPACVAFVAFLIFHPSLLTGVLAVIGITGSSNAVYRTTNVAHVLRATATGLVVKTIVGRTVSITWDEIDQLQRWPAQSIPPTEFVRIVARDGRSLTFNSRMFKSAAVTHNEMLALILKHAPAVRSTKVPRHVRFLTG